LRKWWEQYPGRLEFELEALRKSGSSFEIDQEELAQGRVVMSGRVAMPGGDDVRVIVAFPDTYPHTRFTVYAPDLSLPRHQNPTGGNLCLLSRNGDAWVPSMYAGEVLQADLPRLVALVKGDPDEMRREEDPQGEPHTEYYTYWPAGGVAVPQEALDLDAGVERGTFTLRADQFDWLARAASSDTARVSGRVVLAELKGVDGRLLARAPDALQIGASSREGGWARLPAPPPSVSPEAFLQHLTDHQLLPKVIWGDRLGGGHVAIIGTVFQEEVSQGHWEDGWVFLVLLKQGKGINQKPLLLRGLRYSRRDLAARIPELAPLRTKKVAVIGLGSLGAPIALDLARAQVGELRLLDHDYFDPSTSVRWPLGLSVGGRGKAELLASVISGDYPFVKTAAWSWRIGTALPPGVDGASDSSVLTNLLDGTDLVIDATAEPNVSRALSTISAEIGLQQIYVWGVDGYGGVASRHAPNSTGCYSCLEWALCAEGSIKPPPAAADAGALRLQPRGCGDVTFAAASTELAPLSTQASRLAFSALCKGHAGAYPYSENDVYVLSLRNPDGSLVDPPSWTAYRLPVDTRCLSCRA
jgi:hypothetical protein